MPPFSVYVFTAHGLQPAAVWYEPAAHFAEAAHTVEPSEGAYVLGAQSMHEVCPATSWYVPAGQFAQPPAVRFVPAGQSFVKHLIEPTVNV
jgi:hypothetical protein